MTTPQPSRSTPLGQPFPTLLKPAKPVGIVGYGAYVPRYRLPAKEVARVWTGGKGGLPIKEKAVPGLDEDVITMSIEAARNAMKRAQIDPTELRAVWVGSESTSICGQTHFHVGRRSNWRSPQHASRRLGIRLQSRH